MTEYQRHRDEREQLVPIFFGKEAISTVLRFLYPVKRDSEWRMIS